MNRNELFKKAANLAKNDWSELFMVRKNANKFYISMKNGPFQVEGTPLFDEWNEAKTYLKDNWRKLYDEEFERLVLVDEQVD